jgi:AcrR family transcriptional regulator
VYPSGIRGPSTLNAPTRTRTLREPQQARSRGTRERLIKAAQELLVKHDFRGLTVRQIATRAHVSVGTFYKHFPAKRDLLPVLVDQVQSVADIKETQSTFKKLVGVPLIERVAWLVGFVATTTIRRRNILRVCVAARYATDLKLSSIQATRSREHMRGVQDWLLECKGEISHPDPKLAVRVGVYLTLQSLQTALLFEQIPADLSQRRLIAEAERMLLCYLTTH